MVWIHTLMAGDIEIHWELEVIGLLHDVQVGVFERQVILSGIAAGHLLAGFNEVFRIQKTAWIVRIVHLVNHHFPRVSMNARETAVFVCLSVLDHHLAIEERSTEGEQIGLYVGLVYALAEHGVSVSISCPRRILVPIRCLSSYFIIIQLDYSQEACFAFDTANDYVSLI